METTLSRRLMVTCNRFSRTYNRVGGLGVRSRADSTAVANFVLDSLKFRVGEFSLVVFAGYFLFFFHIISLYYEVYYIKAPYLGIRVYAMQKHKNEER